MNNKEFSLTMLIVMIAAFSIPVYMTLQSMNYVPPLISPEPQFVAGIDTDTGRYLVTDYVKKGKCVSFTDGAGNKKTFCDHYKIMLMNVTPTSNPTEGAAHP